MTEPRMLGLGLVARSEEFSEALITQSFCDVDTHGRDWLKLRYEQIVPIVLTDALHSVETGEPLPGSCLKNLRAAAAEAAEDPAVRLSVVLRGAMPALRVFTGFIHGMETSDPRITVTAMARAARVAHELGACWAEAWNEECRRPGVRSALLTVPIGSSSATSPTATIGSTPSTAGTSLQPEVIVDLVASSADLDETEQRMLELTAQGMSNETIAVATSYSRQAVGWHLARIMRAWRAPNRTALVALAFVKGVLVARTTPAPILSIESPDAPPSGNGQSTGFLPANDVRPLPDIGAPAIRALADAGIRNLDDAKNADLDHLGSLHGVGPGVIRLVRAALENS